MRFLKTNTAVIITVGPFYDKTDGVTIETALTITNERITLTADTDDGAAPTNILDNIAGATAATANDLNYITGNDAGMMQLELAAANVNRLGRMFLSITDAANHVPVFHEFMVLPAMIYDAFILGTDVLQADMTQILGTAVATPATAGLLDVNVKEISSDATAANNAELMFDGTGYAGGTTKLGVDAVALSGDSVAADNLESEYDGTGYGHVLQRTTIATLATQVSFTLTAGSADNNAYNGCIIVIQDAATAAQKAVGIISAYTGATKTVTLLNDPAVFTMATTDIVTIIADRALKPTVDNRTLDVSTGGEAGVDWANVGTPGSTVGLSATTVGVLTTYTGNTLQTGDSFSRIGLAGASLTDLGGMSTAMKAQVNTEALDVLNTDTFAEPAQGTPAATSTLVNKIGYLYKFLRNRITQTATQLSIYNDDAATVDHKSTVSDNGTTYDRGEIASGP